MSNLDDGDRYDLGEAHERRADDAEEHGAVRKYLDYIAAGVSTTDADRQADRNADERLFRIAADEAARRDGAVFLGHPGSPGCAHPMVQTPPESLGQPIDGRLVLLRCANLAHCRREWTIHDLDHDPLMIADICKWMGGLPGLWRAIRHSINTVMERVEATIMTERHTREPGAIRFLLWDMERGQWWLQSRRGYTSEVGEAGRFTREIAVEECLSAAFGGTIGGAVLMIVAPEHYQAPSATATVHSYPCDAYRIGVPESCTLCHQAGREQDARIDAEAAAGAAYEAEAAEALSQISDAAEVLAHIRNLAKGAGLDVSVVDVHRPTGEQRP